MNYLKDPFSHFKQLYIDEEESDLEKTSSGKHRYQERFTPEIEQAVIDLAISNPALGQLRASNELKKQGISLSSGSIRHIWISNDLDTIDKRFKALEEKRKNKKKNVTK